MMNSLKKIFLLLSVLPFVCWSEEMLFDESRLNERQLECADWRKGVESNDIIRAWTTIPKECGDYVEAYMIGREYEVDLKEVCNNAEIYATSFNVSKDGKDAWIFDVDETLISNLPYYAEHDYGLEVYDSRKFAEWVEMGRAPAIESSLKLYEDVINLGFKVILLTGRSEKHRNITAENLYRVGFRDWEKLILRSLDDDEKPATKYKSEKRNELIQEGYRIVANFGDQWSDLLGAYMSNRSFKLPNPMYYIP